MSERLPFSDASEPYTAEQMQEWGRAFGNLNPNFEFSNVAPKYTAEQLAAMRTDNTPHPSFTHPEVDVPLEEGSANDPAFEFSHPENHKTSDAKPPAGITEVSFDDGKQI